MNEIILHISPKGDVRTVYDDRLDLSSLGRVEVTRASFVEPYLPPQAGSVLEWWADLSPVKGPKFGPFVWRKQALEVEQLWLEEHLGELA